MTTTGFKADRDGIYIEKDADGVLDYTLDWSDWLGTNTISSSTWSVETITGDSDALTIDSNTNTTTKSTVFLSGGSVGNVYKVYNTIGTSNSLTERRHFRVRVTNRS